MATVRVIQAFQVSAERVFDALADQENMSAWMGSRISVASVGAQGLVGTVRRVHLGPAHFDERILEIDRPRHIGYAIVSAPPGLVHHRGDLWIVPKGEQRSEVTWTVDVALRPAPLTIIVRAVLSLVLTLALKRLARQLSSRA